MSEKMSNGIDVRKKEDLDAAFNAADSILKRGYLPCMAMKEVFPANVYKSDTSDSKELAREISQSVRLVQLEKIVFNKNENARDKLVSVYKSVANMNSSLLLLIMGGEEKVVFYLGTRRGENVAETCTVLENSLRGNFPGTQEKVLRNNSVAEEVLSNLHDASYISAVSAIPALRSDKEDKEHQFVQGIEKFIDTMRGKKYSMLLIADSKSKEDVEASRRALETLYSQLVPFAESTYSYGENESEALTHSVTTGVAHTISKTITDSVTHTVGTSHTEGESTNVNKNQGAMLSVAGAVVGTGIGGLVGTVLGGQSGSAVGGILPTFSKGKNSSDTTNSSTAKGQSEANGLSDTTSKNEMEGETQTEGSSRQIQIKFENHTVKKLMERIESQLKRYDKCADLGMWNCATYFLGETSDLPAMAANTYQSLICGENSSLENDYTINWDAEKSGFVKPYLMRFEHPEFSGFTPGTLVSSAELAIAAGLPNHSVPGLPVLECAEFGRTVSGYDLDKSESPKIQLGKIWHMNHQEELDVRLDVNSLASHVFITGSTGSGKSNTVCQILSEAKLRGTKFLVIEPAKGEYKNVFGGMTGVNVFGTNPNFAPLLRLNPFYFDSDSILVHEHIDRLISIFNVCWPMYAAMPAVLKMAVEKSYADAGWDLENPFARNRYDNSFFPTFADVARNVRTIINFSEYDAENKGAYKGSLLTRLTSLTNGINGMVFVGDEIGEEKLFDENTIIDLSRVGSAETKSLIMGILILKLQEYRLTRGGRNEDLKHITVLEEAHNLLKRTSTDTSSENGNLQGRSVEMISNAIAEMRTYGEGFIIADQGPGLLDMAAIRNTNTKIIMRLPDLDDRELVGKAANLNDDQITELAKLPRGVAAVYQNEWVQTVLCKVEKFKNENEFEYEPPHEKGKDNILQQMKIAEMLSKGERLSKEVALKELSLLDISGVAKARAVEILENPPSEIRITKIALVMSALFPKARKQLADSFASSVKVSDWTRDVEVTLGDVLTGAENQVRRDIIQAIITDYIYNEMQNVEMIERWCNEGDLK